MRRSKSVEPTFHFGENLKRIRLAKGISQEAMAYGLGMSQATYSRIERQAAIPDQKIVQNMAKLLAVTEAELLPPGLRRVQVAPDPKGSIKQFLNTPIGLLIVIAAGAYLVDVAYQIGQGFCEGLGTDHVTLVIVSWAMALGTMVTIWVMVKKMRKMG